MILAVDPGMARCGWAIVEPGTGAVDDLGVICTERDTALSVAADRARRVAAVAKELDRIAFGRATFIAAEEPLSFGTVHAVAPQAMVWGALCSLAQTLQVPLHMVSAKAWQHAVAPSMKKINYDELEIALTKFVGRDLLASIPSADRTHALDAVGVGVLVALRPHLATTIL